jgi:catechol 2,3-dioxygenase-like lactoylglutathione lyase family enzyme
MKINVTSLYVDDRDKALRFYTEILGFAKKADFSSSQTSKKPACFRWALSCL